MTHIPRAPRSLSGLLDALDPDNPETGAEDHPTDAHDGLTVQSMLNRAGPRSFAAILLVPALILVSPLSIIPLMPTTGGLVILIIAIQAFFGRSQIWLPSRLANRKITASQLARAVKFLRRPAHWLDSKSRDRLRFLTIPPLDRIALLSVMAVAATWPFLEIVPMFTSISAGGVALVAFGLMVRDGLVLIAGYCVLAGTLLFVLQLIAGLF